LFSGTQSASSEQKKQLSKKDLTKTKRALSTKRALWKKEEKRTETTPKQSQLVVLNENLPFETSAGTGPRQKAHEKTPST
jgi:hypothetical protein